MDDEFDGLGGLLLGAEDVLEAVLQEVDAASLCQLKAVSRAWGNHARRELCNRLWVELSRREGQPEPAGVDSITDLDVECLNEAGRPWEVVVAGRQLPQLARLHGWGFVVDLQAVREALLFLGGDTLRSCIQGEGDPPDELLLAAVACAADGWLHGVPVQLLREVPFQPLGENDACDVLDIFDCEDGYLNGIGVTGATLLALMLPAVTDVRTLSLYGNGIGAKGASALSAILKETQITKLNLVHDRIGDEGASALAAILKETKITHLNLKSNSIGVEGASALAAVLKETQITYLNIGSNRIGDEGAAALAAVLRETKITFLGLQFSGLSDKAKQALRDAAGSNVRISC